jgi:4-amino-4-deoxy-L-arabinose transferase-like glycosyltransferase
MLNLPKSSSESKAIDISWKLFFSSYTVLALVIYFFDEVFRPMRGVGVVEMVIWYFGYSGTFLVIPGLPILLFHRKFDTPKKTTLIFGFVLMTFSLLMTGRHLSST